MKAWQFSKTSGGLEKNLQLNTSAPLPPKAASLGADQTLVKVVTAALNPVDYKLAEIPLVGRLVFSKPACPGIDYAGRVVASGSTSGLQPGQLVFGRLSPPARFGTLAEYTIAPNDGCAPLPKGVSADDAACVGTAGLTAYQSIAPNVKAGGRIFINGGSGGTGVFGIQVGKVLGCHVVTTCSTTNVELCKSLGADEVIDYKSQNILGELQKMDKFDLVVDNVGTPNELYYQAHSYLKEGQKYVQVGAAVSLAGTATIMSRMMLPAFLGGGKRPFELLGAKNNAKSFEQMAQWMQQGKVKAVVAEKFAFEGDGPMKAYQMVRSGRSKGKVLVGVSDE